MEFSIEIFVSLIEGAKYEIFGLGRRKLKGISTLLGRKFNFAKWKSLRRVVVGNSDLFNLAIISISSGNILVGWAQQSSKKFI